MRSHPVSYFKYPAKGGGGLLGYLAAACETL
jgi:hypothetical protein